MIKTITPAQLLDSIKVGKQPLAIEIKLQNGQIRRFYWHEEKHYDTDGYYSMTYNDDDEIRMYTYSSHDYWNDHDILSLMDAVEARKIYISEGK